MRRLEWRRANTLRLAFVIADAPAHHYEQQDYTYDQAILDAAVGVKIFPIASGGSDPVAQLQFRQLAQFTRAISFLSPRGMAALTGVVAASTTSRKNNSRWNG